MMRRAGIAGVFGLDFDIADGHHTAHFDFDGTALARGTLLLSGLLAAVLSIS